MSKKKRRQRPSDDSKPIQPTVLSYRIFTTVAVVVICLLGSIIYSNSLEGPFVFDDINNIEENSALHVKSLSPSRLYEASTAGRAPRPVAYFTFALNYYFGELDVTGYHVVNIAIHLASGVLVFFLASLTYRLYFGGNQGKLAARENNIVGWLSLFAACLFVAHPLQTQAVTYLVQRMTSLSTMFFLLSLLLYVLGRLQQISKQRKLYWGGCFIAGILAIGSKQIAITLPVIILLYEWYFFQDLNKAWATRQAKYVLVLFGFLIVASLLFLGTSPWERILTHYNMRDFTMGERVLTQFRVVVDYISLAILPLPSRLNILHNVKVSHSFFDPITTLLSFLTLVGMIGFAVYIARGQRLVSFCILWFFINLALESSIIALELIYEHRLYLPMFGIALLVPYLMQQCLSNRPKVVAAILGIVILCLGYGTYVRNQAWQDTITLWTDVVDKDPSFHRGYTERAHHYRLKGKLDLAIPEYTKAIEVDKNNALTYLHRGIAYGKMNKYTEAIEDFSQAIKLKPEDPRAFINRGHIHYHTNKPQLAIEDYTKAIEAKSDSPYGYSNRGEVYHLMGKPELAIQDFTKAIELKPDLSTVYNKRGIIHVETGDLEKAIADYSHAINLTPTFAPAYNNLGDAYQKQGKYQLAVTNFQQATELAPNLMPPYESLAWILAACPTDEIRNGQRAIEYAKRACQLTKWTHPKCFDALAAAYAEAGEFPEAIKWITKAIQSAPANKIEELNQRLTLYQASQPYRLELPSKTQAQIDGEK